MLKQEGRRGCATHQRTALLYGRAPSVSHKWSCKDAAYSAPERLSEPFVCLCVHIAVYMLYIYFFILAIKPMLCYFIISKMFPLYGKEGLTGETRTFILTAG